VKRLLAWEGDYSFRSATASFAPRHVPVSVARRMWRAEVEAWEVTTASRVNVMTQLPLTMQNDNNLNKQDIT